MTDERKERRLKRHIFGDEQQSNPTARRKATEEAQVGKNEGDGREWTERRIRGSASSCQCRASGHLPTRATLQRRVSRMGGGQERNQGLSDDCTGPPLPLSLQLQSAWSKWTDGRIWRGFIAKPGPHHRHHHDFVQVCQVHRYSQPWPQIRCKSSLARVDTSCAPLSLSFVCHQGNKKGSRHQIDYTIGRGSANDYYYLFRLARLSLFSSPFKKEERKHIWMPLCPLCWQQAGWGANTNATAEKERQGKRMKR